MRRRHLQTDFVKFILEKYTQDGQGLPEDEDFEDEPNDDENEEPQLRKRKKVKRLNEFECTNRDITTI